MFPQVPPLIRLELVDDRAVLTGAPEDGGMADDPDPLAIGHVGEEIRKCKPHELLPADGSLDADHSATMAGALIDHAYADVDRRFACLPRRRDVQRRRPRPVDRRIEPGNLARIVCALVASRLQHDLHTRDREVAGYGSVQDGAKCVEGDLVAIGTSHGLAPYRAPSAGGAGSLGSDGASALQRY